MSSNIFVYNILPVSCWVVFVLRLFNYYCKWNYVGMLLLRSDNLRHIILKKIIYLSITERRMWLKVRNFRNQKKLHIYPVRDILMLPLLLNSNSCLVLVKYNSFNFIHVVIWVRRETIHVNLYIKAKFLVVIWLRLLVSTIGIFFNDNDFLYVSIKTDRFICWRV